MKRVLESNKPHAQKLGRDAISPLLVNKSGPPFSNRSKACRRDAESSQKKSLQTRDPRKSCRKGKTYRKGGPQKHAGWGGPRFSARSNLERKQGMTSEKFAEEEKKELPSGKETRRPE